MSLSYKYYIKFNDNWGSPHFGLLLPDDSRNLINVSSLMHNYGGILSKQQLLIFVNDVIAGKNEESGTGANEYFLMVVKKDGKIMLKIYTELPPPLPPAYISPQDMKELLEVWIREETKFHQNPEQYKEEMLKKGAVLVLPKDFKESTAEQKMEAAQYGIVEDWREAKSDKLDMLPRESPAKGKTGEPSHPWWQFWK